MVTVLVLTFSEIEKNTPLGLDNTIYQAWILVDFYNQILTFILDDIWNMAVNFLFKQHSRLFCKARVLFEKPNF